MTEPVSLPLPSASPQAPPTPRPARWPDTALAVLVLAFAFLASSFAARNSDLWLHLAAGRLLAHGDYIFGVDPFAYTTTGVYWANHAWLSDLALYAGYRTLGGAALVVLKAAAVAALAGLMLRGARGEGPFWVSAGCTLLALLAMSPRLLLQPACLSLLLLAVCLCLLRTGGRALYALPAVIALWVNLDAWFLLGPLLVALFGLGQLLALPASDSRRLPLWQLPACLLACLLNPHHFHALTLPPELSPAVWGSAFRHDDRFAGLFASPWRLRPLGPAGGFNLAAWAYFVLLALGSASFAVHRLARRDWRLPVWLAFALLGAWQVRLVPFFAVIAGPITALNLRQWLARYPPTPNPSPQRGEGRKSHGRAGVLLAGLVLLALTWPGWLQGFQRGDRPLAWAVHTDPWLHRVTETLARWRAQGDLPEGVRTFAVHPDVAHYCAWFCPGEKGFLDSRWQLFVPVAADFERLCLALEPSLQRLPDGAEPSAPSAWQQTLTDNTIGCLVLYAPDLSRLAAGLHQLARPSPDWDVLRVDGQAILVGWKGATHGLPASLRLDAERRAFGPGRDEALPPAPAAGPAELNRPLPWWDPYRNHPGGSTWEAGAAAVYLRLFEGAAEEQLGRQARTVLARQPAGLAGLPALPAGAVPAAVAVGARVGLEEVFLPDLQERPAALPLLAVRAARRAVDAHPDDANAWLFLAQAYRALGRTTTEATSTAALGPLAQVRHVQIVTALVQAVTLRPDLGPAHAGLAELFAERHYLDLALRHRRAQLHLARQAGRLGDESEADQATRIERLEKTIGRLQREVQDSENRFVIQTSSLAGKPLARAEKALNLGLVGKALDEILLHSHPDLFGPPGFHLLLELLLQTGRAQEARDLLDRDEMRRETTRQVRSLPDYNLPGNRPGEHRWGYRFPAYEWFDLCQSAAAGDYDHATTTLKRLGGLLQRSEEGTLARLAPWGALALTSEVGLGAVPEALSLRPNVRLLRDQILVQFVPTLFLSVERADLHVLEAMLLLERGLPRAAGEHFRHALALYDRAADSVPALPGKPLALRYLERLRQQ